MSLIPFVVLVALIFLIIKYFGADALSGASQVALIIASGVTIAIGLIFYRRRWEDIDEGITANIKGIGSALIILLLIGAIGGTWMVSGIVPTLICYGLKVLSPRIFLFACCIICALVSLMTGSSWTTIATLGVALIAIGTALGYSEAWTAGAIISGAYFGDKISPLSDTTVLASSSAGTPLFTHIRYMMITTVPSITISLIIFLVTSLGHPVATDAGATMLTASLKETFHISPWLLTVPVITGIMIAKKVPAMLTLLSAAIMAGITALIAQPGLVSGIGGGADILDFETGFKGIFQVIFGETALQTGNSSVDELVRTGGMNGMLPTVFLIICAATYGGTLKGCGMVKSLTDALTSRIKSRTSLVGATVGTGLMSNIIMGDQYLSIILTCSIFKELYEKEGYEGRLLSRSTEDAATVTSVLIPWNSCGMTQATVLRVPTLTYLPYCFFNIISPMMSIFIAAIGYKIVKRKTVPGAVTEEQ